MDVLVKWSPGTTTREPPWWATVSPRTVDGLMLFRTAKLSTSISFGRCLGVIFYERPALGRI